MAEPVYIRHVNEPDARPGRTTQEAWDDLWQHKTLPESDEPAWVRVNEDGSAYRAVGEMTVEELRAYADRNGVDIAGARTKAQLLAAVEGTPENTTEGDQ